MASNPKISLDGWIATLKDRNTWVNGNVSRQLMPRMTWLSSGMELRLLSLMSSDERHRGVRARSQVSEAGRLATRWTTRRGPTAGRRVVRGIERHPRHPRPGGIIADGVIPSN